MKYLSIFIRVALLALGQSLDCHSASEVSLMDMGKSVNVLPQQSTAKQKTCAYFLGYTVAAPVTNGSSNNYTDPTVAVYTRVNMPQWMTSTENTTGQTFTGMEYVFTSQVQQFASERLNPNVTTADSSTITSGKLMQTLKVFTYTK